ncbi:MULTISPECIES: SDR family NAD(P)-dependent oxidoreductase [Nitrospirillum]|uniref:3alpha(Or 20beta)-hydroxysteroid dehydrogenase n=1 Tax=Nitrospirillum amazonense TaxID=28077 RepID=A0A560FVH1_9PROT|nr:glucose 1-dehydrogenase [Nitrospirillum amazonense]TWB18428.1 3alpha(or 20beta)-hydroxysteroid dehydrogenase [Nitrospirillum amazonense]TWB25643.1 3alpha(or 20beta)-hydroxysteroid dehydrogenase [Nitrospirillum amazonense]TWB66051.1 3alpha(or 20beta)-hydroxysteroid dehydrogenase [Nitrospirillum amazonense]
MDRLKDRVAIVTGGAKGMGAATCRLFAAEGAYVVVADMADDEGRALAMELGPRGQYFPLDVRKGAAWEALVADVTQRWGRIDALVNNAGVLHFADIEHLAEEDFDRVYQVNVKGAFLGLKHVGGVMKAAGRGAVVNISSIDGLRGSNGVAAYVASKWALRGLTRAAALELGHHGVRVNSVHPGGIDTTMGNPMGLSGQAKNRGYEVVPLQRMGETQEVAAASLFLCSDDASYICGAELAVDGGWSAGHYHVFLQGAPSSIAQSFT